MRRTPPARDAVAPKSPETSRPRPGPGPAAAQSPSPRRPPDPPAAAAPPASPRDAKLANIRRLLEEVERALEADKQARAALQNTLVEARQASLSESAADISFSGLAGSVGTVGLDAVSIDTTPFKAAAVLQGKDRLSPPLSGLLLDGAERTFGRREDVNGHHPHDHHSGVVYNRTLMEKESKLHEVGTTLGEQQRRGRDLEAALAEAKRHAAEEKMVLLGQLSAARDQLEQARDEIRALELEHAVFTTHKEALVNALKHERSLVNFAISKMEQHHIDASHLKRLQQQFAVDSIGGTFVSTSFSVPPMLGGVAAPDATPERRRLEQQVGRPLPDSVRDSGGEGRPPAPVRRWEDE